MLTLFCALVLADVDPRDPVRPEIPSATTIVHDLKYIKGEARLLAFFAQEDDRPLYVEGALVVVRRGESWQLIHAYRHPKEINDAAPSVWKQSVIFDLPGFVGERTYDHRPTAAEVDKFLKDTRWTFKPSIRFRLIRGEVFSKTWKEALGYAPKHTYIKP